MPVLFQNKKLSSSKRKVPLSQLKKVVSSFHDKTATRKIVQKLAYGVFRLKDSCMGWVIRCIRVIEFWRLKPGFRRILSSNARKCTRKVRFYKPCTSAASESEFNHAKRILCLEVGVLVYSVRVIKMSRLTIDCVLILWSLHGSLRCCETDREIYGTTFLSLRHAIHWERTTPMSPKMHLKPLGFLTASIRHLKFFVCAWP